MQGLSTLISSLISDLNPRQKTVLQKRFCLDGKSKRGLTLAELGGRYDVTRERIRQIEEAAFASVRKKIASGLGRDFFAFLKDQLDASGGAMKESLISSEIENYLKEKLTLPQLRFLLEASGNYDLHSEDKDFHSFWHEGSRPYQLVKAVVDRSSKHLSANKDEVLREKNFMNVFPSVAREAGVSESVGLGYLAVSKKFGINRYGDFGLTEWPEIQPKTVRDRAYLVLREAGKPLHFSEIANLIRDRKFDSKPVHASTAHNELIKDGRFVLVGRGIYALSEHGFIPGTAREVIARILKENGPMKLEDIVAKVSKERLFKENTIVLNLQNKKMFRKLEGGAYHVQEGLA